MPSRPARARPLILVGGFLLFALVALAQATTGARAAEPVRPEVTGARPQGADGDLTIDSVPDGFQDSIVIDGLSSPTAIAFAPDGRVFVAEKSGRIKVFSGLDDTTPVLFADLSTKVYDFWDRGLLGLAVAPGFPADPSVYVLYTYDHILGEPAGNVPRWQFPGATSSCPGPLPGPTTDGCVVSARLSRLTMGAGGTSTGETVLIEDWCQQFPSHSIGTVMFGPEGSLYVGAGDGASFTVLPDKGQLGGSAGSPTPVNPCGDPLNEGGNLRSQDLRTSGDPQGLDGSILRLDPANGHPWPTNPNAGSGDANLARIVATGFRNPFRFTLRQSTGELWVGDVGNNRFEEIDRIVPGGLRNGGWPCFEGVGRFAAFDSADLPICETLYAEGASAVVSPTYSWDHRREIVTGDGCGGSPTGTAAVGSAVAGITFYNGGDYPSQYDGGLFFLDHNRECLYWMHVGAGGVPDASTTQRFASGVVSPVQLVTGPNGDLFYVAFDPTTTSSTDGSIHRIRYLGPDTAPVASFTASTTSPALNETVTVNAAGSSDADGDPLTYAWDLDGDGQYDDGSTVTRTTSFSTPGNHTIRLRVSDGRGGTATAAKTISVANAAPVPVIDTPTSAGSHPVGQVVSFSGHASDPDEGALGASALSWTIAIEHCPSNCHEHIVDELSGIASGSFAMPDHTYPSHIELRLTATDEFGKAATVSREIDYALAVLALRSSPTGANLLLDGTTYKTPADVTVLKGSAHQLEALPTQTLGGILRSFVRWSDGGARSHTIVASTDRTFTATYSGPDITPPTVALIRPTTVVGATAGPSVPGRIRWSASDTGTGIARYELWRSTDGGAHWTAITLSPVTRTDAPVTLSPGTAYRFRVRARDGAGNWSGWATTSFTPGAVQESAAGVTYSGSWTTVSSSDFWAGHLRRADAFGEAVSYTFTGRAIAWVGPVGPSRGKVRIYVDGVLRTTLDLGSPTGATRRVLYATDFGGLGRHTIRIADLATSGRPLMDHDAFVVYGAG